MMLYRRTIQNSLRKRHPAARTLLSEAKGKFIASVKNQDKTNTYDFNFFFNRQNCDSKGQAGRQVTKA